MNRTPRELNQGGTGTSETVFTSDGTLPVICHLPAAAKLADANNVSTAMFKVRAWGRVTGGTTTNFTVQLQYGTSATASSNTDIEASTARAVDSASHNWFIEAKLCWDTTSNKIQGCGHAMVANLYDVWAAADNAITSADPDADSEQGFVVTGTFSSGNASNVAVMDGFVLEEV